MKFVMDINKVKKVVISIIAIMLVVSAFIGIYQLKKKQREEAIHADYVEKQQEMFEQFKELFYLQNDNMQVVVDELLLIDEFNNPKTLDFQVIITYDEYPKGQSYNYGVETIVLNYNDRTFFSQKADKEVLDKLNADARLKDALDELVSSKMIAGIYLGKINSFAEITFEVSTEIVPFIPNNAERAHYFAYCEEQDLQVMEKYGFIKLENNWYMRITEIMQD